MDTGGGDLTVTGLINSGNSYKAYIYGTDDWNNNEMIQNMVKQYLEDGTVPAYHYIGITYERDSNGNLKEDGKGATSGLMMQRIIQMQESREIFITY